MLTLGREDEAWKFPLGKCGNEVLVIEIKTKWTLLGAFDKGKAHLFRVYFVWSCLWGEGVRDRRWEKGQLKTPKQVHFSLWDYLFTHLLKSDGSHHCSCFAWFARTPPGHIKKYRKAGTLFFMLGFIKKLIMGKIYAMTYSFYPTEIGICSTFSSELNSIFFFVW